MSTSISVLAPSISAASEIEFDTVLTLGDTRVVFVRYPQYRENDFYAEGAEIVVYMPQKVPIYRGIFFGDRRGHNEALQPWLFGRYLALYFNSI